MNKNIEHLRSTIKQFEEALKWLNRSYKICKKHFPEVHYTEEQLDDFEALTARFARSVDMLIHKVFRAMDAVEMVQEGSLIDVVNRAHKRGLFAEVEPIHYMKDLRNAISHEYRDAKLIEIFEEVMKQIEKK